MLQLGDYHVSDIEFVAAFDVDEEKVGKDLSEAIFSGQNNTYQIQPMCPSWTCRSSAAPPWTASGNTSKRSSTESDEPVASVADVLRETKTDVVVLLPARRQRRSNPLVRRAGAGSRLSLLVNAIPVFIASDPYWQLRFRNAGVPIIGDDIKSQVGATITHRVLTRLFEDRGVRIDRTYQLNFGGNTDFMNMLERDRLQSKKISKTNAVTSQILATMNSPRMISMSVPAIIFPGLMTVNGATSASRAPPLAMFP